MPTLKTEEFIFASLNERGNPPMGPEKVLEDLEYVLARCDVCVVQEFKWSMYWKMFKKVIEGKARHGWRSSPNTTMGMLFPNRGAQPIWWKSADWRKIRAKVWLLHKGEPGVSETRYLRAVLLENKTTGLRVWFWTTHFVVGGDYDEDSDLRQEMLAGDIEVMDEAMAYMSRWHKPIIGGLDANLTPHSDVWKSFSRILKKHNVYIIGAPGVEFILAIQGTRTEATLIALKPIPTTRLHTDHEVRRVRFNLRRA
jgi:hypothetical protein